MSTSFSLRDLTCVLPSIKLDECGHVEKYGRAGRATDDSVIQSRKDAVCMQDNKGKNTHTHTRDI